MVPLSGTLAHKLTEKSVCVRPSRGLFLSLRGLEINPSLLDEAALDNFVRCARPTHHLLSLLQWFSAPELYGHTTYDITGTSVPRGYGCESCELGGLGLRCDLW